jgi:hypothetical protein
MPKTILLYQMGKVGSAAVKRGFIRCGFEPIDTAEAIVQKSGDLVLHTHSHADAAATILRSKECNRELVVVSLVRELLGRTISTFFQNVSDRKHPWFLADRETVEALSTDDLIDAFRARHVSGFRGSIEPWFDHFNEVVGVDAFAKPFPTDRGYCELPASEGVAKVALIRQENLSAAGSWLGEFVGAPFVLREIHRTADKWQGRQYADFLSTFRPTQDELDLYYNCRIMRHFYSPEEIRAFRARWETPRQL